MATVNVLEDEYQFLLQAYEIRPATEESLLEFLQASLVGMRIAKDTLSEIQNQMRQTTLRAEDQVPSFRKGRQPGPRPGASSQWNLDILYYLITKVQRPCANVNVPAERPKLSGLKSSPGAMS
jgi:hypothetical protein